MNINIGENIRCYRIQRELTQEKLADALGVSCQAVSRWELNRGYPDVEMLPRIANYFQITLDDLFGYSKEYEERICEIVEKADEYLNTRQKMDECVSFLREATEKFPAEGRIWYRFCLALSFMAAQNNDIRIKDRITGDEVEFDIERNINNDLLRELVLACEKTLSMDISQDERDVITISLSSYYAVMGMNEKAMELACQQSIIYAGREYLMAFSSDDAHREANTFNLIITLFRMLKQAVCWSVGTKHSLRSCEKGIRILNSIVELYTNLLGEDLGLLHSDIYDIYVACICISARTKDLDRLKKYIDLCIYHRKEYENLRKNSAYKHSSFMFSSIEYDGTKQPEYTIYRLQDVVKSFPDDIRLKLFEDEKYKKLLGV